MDKQLFMIARAPCSSLQDRKEANAQQHLSERTNFRVTPMSSCLWKVAVRMALFGFVATLEVPAAVAKEPTAITDQTKSFEVSIGTLHMRLQ